MKEPIKIAFQLTDGSHGFVKITDGVVLCKFTKKDLAKQIYKIAKAEGKDCFLENNFYIEKYKNKTAEEIKIILTKEMKSVGGKLQ